MWGNSRPPSFPVTSQLPPEFLQALWEGSSRLSSIAKSSCPSIARHCPRSPSHVLNQSTRHYNASRGVALFRGEAPFMPDTLTQETVATLGIPAPGALVTVRRRQWVVESVKRSSFPSQVIGPDPRAPMHLLSLVSVEDDALGEELQVIWEVEPGAHLHESFALPDTEGFDDPRRLEGFLDAVRWGAVVNADREHLQAPFRSGIEIEEYQLEPVVRCLEMPRVNLLLADDVGLGKTIESGLVVQELMLRNRVRSVLILCPAALCVQWKEQMRDKFGLEFRIVDSELIQLLRRQRGIHVNPWTHFPRLIASIDYFKRDRPLRRFREALPSEIKYPRDFDLLIVDEAHNVAPSGSGNYAIDSQRTEAIRLIAPHFEHKLFLTATPHNGYQESFTALLELLDDQRFARGMEPDKKQLGAVMVRRLKSDIKDWDGSARFALRVLKPIEVPYTPEERDAHSTLKAYTEMRRKSASDKTQRTATEFVLKLLKKRLFSSPAAFDRTLTKHRETARSAKPRKTRKPPSIKILQTRIAGLEEDYSDDIAFEETTEELIETTADCMSTLSTEELGHLDRLVAWAGKTASRPDSKAQALLDWLHAEIKPGGQWSNNRVIIFTEYRDTQKWLFDLLAHRGMVKDKGGERLMTLYGGLDTDERERVKAAFQAHPDDSPVRILLATDAASEGIDLQNHCHLLIHYEIPWNPNRLEQRNGRIDRHGQKQKEVLIHHFVGQGFQTRKPGEHVSELEGDLEFLARAVQKIEAIRQDLGKVGPVIASQVEEAMLGYRTKLDTTDAERQASKGRRALKVERELRTLEETRNRLHEARESLRVEPEHIQQVVSIGLQLGEKPALKPAKEADTFWMPPLEGDWAICSSGLLHPHTQKSRPITFRNELVKGRDDLVLVHLNHPLVQRCLRLLRGEVWNPDGEKKIYRVTARRVPNHLLSDPVVIAHARLLVLGGKSHRLHEEMVIAGGRIREGRFRRLGQGELSEALDAAGQILPPEPTLAKLKNFWPDAKESLQEALRVREKERTETLENRLARKMEREVADLEAVLHQLEKQIREALEEDDAPEQLELFTTDEKDQWGKDRDLLKIRLEKIPEEITKESEAIRRRYDEPVPRLFPVAVTWLMPERLCR